VGSAAGVSPANPAGKRNGASTSTRISTEIRAFAIAAPLGPLRIVEVKTSVLFVVDRAIVNLRVAIDPPSAVTS
jgi:hypothetical protein